MPRTIRDAKLETRAARDRLKPSKKANWKTLVPAQLHLGYRRKRKDEPGLWLLRRYIGNERYRVSPLGLADDFEDAGQGILSFADAQRAAYAQARAQGAQARGSMTVEDAITDYIAWLKANRATGEDAEQRANKLIFPTLGKTKLADLTTTRITNWLNTLATSPALKRTAKDAAKQNVASSPVTKDQLRARRATANRLLTVLKAALNRAFENGHIDTDLEWRRVKPFEKVNAARPGYLSVEEARRLINAADKKSGFRDLVHAALLTGARYGELRALRVRDFHRGKLHIATSKSGRPRDIVLTDEGVTFFEQLTAGRGRD
ncbi:MAG: tyrosine-type recombinase/integrase, partial [Xanthobacteraceae bacterium]